MMSHNEMSFGREQLNQYMFELAKELRKIYGRNFQAEIILVGGASILANYDFREMTTDFDYYTSATNSIKAAINNVGDRFGLPNEWMNTDFIYTESFSPKIVQYSDYYKSFCNNTLVVRTVKAEYLIAMKIRAARQYKHDLSDMVGIFMDSKRSGKEIPYETVVKAYRNLYGETTEIPEIAKRCLDLIYATDDLSQLYWDITEEEHQAKDVLVNFEQKYPDILNKDNLNDILKIMVEKQKEISHDSNDIISADYNGYSADFNGEKLLIYDNNGDIYGEPITDPDELDKIIDEDDLKEYLEKYVDNLDLGYDSPCL